MFKPGFLLFFALLVTASCGPEPTYDKEQMQTQQAAWDEMMEGHDVVMPLMNPLYQASTKLKAVAETAAVEASDFHPRAQQALADIEKAENGMMDWMAGIRDNPLDSVRARYNDHAAVMAFIDKQTVEIEQVAEAMQSSLANAKSLVNERIGQ